MSKFLVETFICTLAVALIVLAMNASMSLCTKAMNNPQAFFEGRVH